MYYLCSDMLNYLLTQAEAELIEVLRNIRKSFPNGFKEQELYARMLFEEFLDLPKDFDEEE